MLPKIPPISFSWHRRFAVPVMKASLVSTGLAGPLVGYGFLVLADSRGVSHVGALSIGVAAGIASTIALGVLSAVTTHLVTTGPIGQIEKGFCLNGKEQVANLMGVDTKTIGRWERLRFRDTDEEELVNQVQDIAKLLRKNTPEATRAALISLTRQELGGTNLKQAIRERRLDDARNAIMNIPVREFVSLE